MQNSPNKSLVHLGQQAGISEASVTRTTKLINKLSRRATETRKLRML